MDVLEVRFESGHIRSYVVVMTTSTEEQPISEDFLMFADGVLHASPIGTYIPIRSAENRYIHFYNALLQYINEAAPISTSGNNPTAYATDAWQYAIESMSPIPYGNIKEVL